MPDYNRPPWTPTRQWRPQTRWSPAPACSPPSVTGAAWSRRSSPSTARPGASTSYISSTPTITRRPRSASCGSSSRVAIWSHRTPCRTRRTPAVRCRQTTSTRCCGRRAGRRYRRTSIPGTTTGALGESRIASPFHGGVRIESYQLVPLLKALRMPRVNLLIADDVGLGKTVEAGLILTELLLRRRIQRVLVLTPASLRQQWREELWEKFSLRFEVVDRQGTERLRRGLGMDATPLALVQPHCGVVSLPAAARRAGAVPGRLPYAGRLPASSLGSADRRRVPQPDAVALRRGQRAVPHAAAGGPAVRAPPLPLRHSPQRTYALVHGAAGDARPGALLPHQRDGSRHAGGG